MLCAILCVAGLAGSISVLLEYPAPVGSALLRTYSAFFLWPLLFFPAACAALAIVLCTTVRFMLLHLQRPRLPLFLLLASVLMITVPMSIYEWFNDKHAVYEVAPALTARPAEGSLSNAQFRIAFAPWVGSFDGLALSIVNRPANVDAPICRAHETGIQTYQFAPCFCRPINKPVSAEQCDAIRQAWYNALGRAVAADRSYTYYFSRISYIAIVAVYASALICVIFISVLGRGMKRRLGKEYEVAKSCCQILSFLAFVWWIQRLYFSTELITIFPSQSDAVYLSFFLSLVAGVILAKGASYAFDIEASSIRSIYDDILVHVPVVLTILLGVAYSNDVITFLRNWFGANSSIAGIALFAMFCHIVCLGLFLRALHYGGAFTLRRAKSG